MGGSIIMREIIWILYLNINGEYRLGSKTADLCLLVSWHFWSILTTEVILKISCSQHNTCPITHPFPHCFSSPPLSGGRWHPRLPSLSPCTCPPPFPTTVPDYFSFEGSCCSCFLTCSVGHPLLPQPWIPPPPLLTVTVSVTPLPTHSCAICLRQQIDLGLESVYIDSDRFMKPGAAV